MLEELLNDWGQYILLLLMVFLLGFDYVLKESRLHFPPGPINFPIVGALPFLGADMRIPIQRMRKKYGDVIYIKLGTKRCVVLNGYDVIKEALVDYADVFSGRPSLFFIEELTKGFGIVSTQGDFWREQRRFAHRALRDVGLGRCVMADKIAEELGVMLSMLEGQAGQPVSLFTPIQMAVANIIGSTVFGYRMEYDDPMFIRYTSTMAETFELVGAAGVLNVFPFLRHLPGDMFAFKKCRENSLQSNREFLELIEQHRLRGRAETSDKPADFVDLYLKAMAKEKHNAKSTFTDTQLVALIGELYSAGTETTSNTLTWGFLFMLRNPDVQRQVCAEIDDVIGRERLPSMSDKVNMPYTEACVSEIQRLADVMPFDVPHGSTKDAYFRGYYIPQGTTILPNLHSINRDPELWPQPDKFDPTRFLDEAGKFRKNDKLIPFSIGKRACLGEALARMELFMFFAAILQRFTLIPLPGHPPPPLEGHLGITHTPMPFKVICTPRSTKRRVV